MFLTETDMRRCLISVPKDLRNLLIRFELILAGGFCRSIIAGEPVSDIDIFGQSITRLQAVADGLATIRREKHHDIKVINTQNAISVVGGGYAPVQFITRWLYDRARQVAQSFDYSVCSAAIQWNDNRKSWESVCHDRFYSDLAAKRLFYMHPERDEDAGGSMLRAVKYTRKGYHISPESLAAVISRLMKGIDTTDWNGADTTGRELLIRGKLREVDPAVNIEGVGEFDEHENIPVLP